jgi:hypothetical protein
LIVKKCETPSPKVTLAAPGIPAIISGKGYWNLLAYYLAGAYAAMGDNSDGFEALDQACAARSNWLNLLKLDLRFYALRSDPRFGVLLQKIGLCLRT